MKNFLVYHDEQTVNIDNQGLVFIQGINNDSLGFESNGAGKTTFLEAIVYCLYGKLSDGKSGDDVINNKINKDTKVTLTFSIGKDIYRIERYRKDKEFKNKTLLFLNDKEITKSSVKLTNEYIEKLVQMSMETFLNSIMFGLTNKTKFPEANDKEKKQILEDMANISVYKLAYDITKQDLAELTSQIDSKESEIAIQNEKLNGIIAQQKMIEEQKNSYANYLNGLKLTYEANAKQWNQFLHDNDLNNFDVLTDRLNTIENELAKVKDKLSSITVDNNVYYQYNKYKSNYENARQEILRYSGNMDRLRNQLQSLATSDNPVCEYCGSVLNEEHKAKEISRLMEEYKEAQAQGKKSNDFAIQSKKQYESMQKEIDDANNAKKAYQDTLAKQDHYLNEQRKCNNLINQYKQLKKTLDLSYDAYNNPDKENTITVQDKSAEIKQINNDISKIKKSKSTLLSKQKDLQAVVEIYSNKGVISHVLDLIMPYINTQANEYLGVLTENSITVKINPQSEAKNGNISEKLNIEVNNLNGGNLYERNSKGEEKRIDLAISLALQDYVMSKSTMKTNFIAYDEVFDGLDEVGTERIMHILKERVKDIPTVFVISHNDKLKELFEKTIRITKQKGLSTIEQEE